MISSVTHQWHGDRACGTWWRKIGFGTKLIRICRLAKRQIFVRLFQKIKPPAAVSFQFLCDEKVPVIIPILYSLIKKSHWSIPISEYDKFKQIFLLVPPEAPKAIIRPRRKDFRLSNPWKIQFLNIFVWIILFFNFSCWSWCYTETSFGIKLKIFYHALL